MQPDASIVQRTTILAQRATELCRDRGFPETGKGLIFELSPSQEIDIALIVELFPESEVLMKADTMNTEVNTIEQTANAPTEPREISEAASSQSASISDHQESGEATDEHKGSSSRLQELAELGIGGAIPAEQRGARNSRTQVPRTVTSLLTACVDRFQKSNGGKPEDDGIDHINIAEQAKTELGRSLRINAPLTNPIETEELGVFKTVNGLVMMLQYMHAEKLRPEHVPQLQGDSIKELAYHATVTKTLPRVPFSEMREIYLIAAELLWISISNDQALCEKLAGNDLPLTAYRTTPDTPLLPQQIVSLRWYVEVLNRGIVPAIKRRKQGNERAKPNFPQVFDNLGKAMAREAEQARQTKGFANRPAQRRTQPTRA